MTKYKDLSTPEQKKMKAIIAGDVEFRQRYIKEADKHEFLIFNEENHKLLGIAIPFKGDEHGYHTISVADFLELSPDLSDKPEIKDYVDRILENLGTYPTESAIMAEILKNQ